MNQTFSVTLDAPVGYEFTGEYRPANHGEIVLDGGDAVTVVGTGSPTASHYFVLRRAWTPPAWLPIETWLYFNANVWKLTNMPTRVRAGDRFPSSAPGSSVVAISVLAALMGQTFTPPPAGHTTYVYQI